LKIPRDVAAEELIKGLVSFGYEVSRQKGSHIRLTYTKGDSTHHITIPNHNPIKVGTLSGILNDLSLFHKREKEEIIKMVLG